MMVRNERLTLAGLSVLARIPEAPKALLLALHGLQGSKEHILALLPGYAERGFVLLAFDAPRHGEREGPPPSSKSPRYVEEVYRVALGFKEEARRVAEEAERRFGLPLFLAGGSLGAFVAHLLLAEGFRPQAVLAFIGSGFPMKLPQGQVVEDPEVLALYEAPPATRGEAYGGVPLLHLHGSRDLIVPLARMEKTLEALRPHYPEGRLARFVEEGAGHTLTPLMARVGLAFLEHWLEAR
ncbi:phospholipase/carboxylesterase superfamily [Thermus thermophilus SG0.5JP17-16]|uniref:Phospholipase/carboxylesterase superfamily n=1 Tax=Thermus thermophilus (strain SG0.5JP17-16) TaxID=762633 RepID=F6DEC6_THETG|nr:alpha/beta hydrolase [Thermus thermophilus]AEG34053.1 phospholipase/carboxylesterase superfamily [Thermus thermophilus SG0.5JP17-16]